ncbi:MAG: GHKL domain-containing protein [Rhodoferax sp.]|nr:GHKL domain-containing protein [Rhodoferax sp.]
MLLTNGFAADKVLEASQTGSDPVSLTEYFAVLEDPSLALTLDDIQKPAVAARFKTDAPKASALSYGYTRSAYWLRLGVRNNTDQALERMLEIDFARLSSIDFHQPLINGAYHSISTGMTKPFATRPYKNRNFVFPITLPAHANQVLYFRIQTAGPMIFPAKLWENTAFHSHERNDYTVQAGYFGMVMAMVLFNLLLFIALRDVLYLFYVNSIICMAFALASNNGLGKEFLWSDAPLWSDMSTYVGFSLACATILLFMRRMLMTWLIIPKLDRLLKLLLGVLLLSLVGLIYSYQTFAKAAVLLYILALLLCMSSSVFCAFKRHRSAYFFVAAFGLFILGGLMFALRALEVLPSNFLTSNGMQLGSALEMILLAFALADRFNQIRREKAKAKAETLLAQSEKLKAQNETLQAQAQAQQLQSDALLTKTQLAQSEKMASLGALIAGVTHEINTPIGAIKSSGANITDALGDALTKLPALLKALDSDSMDRFLDLINRAKEPAPTLSSRETRALVGAVTQQLEEAGIEGARHKASILVKFNIQAGAQSALANYLPLLRHTESELILDTANSLIGIIKSTVNINTAVERVAKIVLALKSFSRVNQAAEMVDANLQDGLETVLTIYNYQIKQHTEVVRNYEVIPPIRCLADELNQVWTNLIHNALQAMETNENHAGTLTIGVRKEGDNAVVSVGDSGCGIPEEVRSKIFDVFFTTKAVGVGSGLGLDIVKKIIDKHKGRIEVQSEVGVGTTFFVYLPYAAVQSA